MACTDFSGVDEDKYEYQFPESEYFTISDCIIHEGEYFIKISNYNEDPMKTKYNDPEISDNT